MSAHELLKLLTEMRKRENATLCRAFYHFFAMTFIKSIIREHECKILFVI